jgi:hypothetical protein
MYIYIFVCRIKSEIDGDAVGAKLVEFMKLDLSSFAEGIYVCIYICMFIYTHVNICLYICI